MNKRRRNKNYVYVLGSVMLLIIVFGMKGFLEQSNGKEGRNTNQKSSAYTDDNEEHAEKEVLDVTQIKETQEVEQMTLDPLPESYMISEEDNYFDYQETTECAAFSSAYVLRHYGEEADGMKLFETFPYKVFDGGVAPYGIETLFQERGYKAQYITNGSIEDLKKEVVKGVPVIVFIRLNEEQVYTHYVPLVGYDKEYFYFAESLKEYANCKEEEGISYNRKTEISTFARLWEDIDGMWKYPYFSISQNEIEE